jgi:oligosaccharide translocation protein RFT1
MPSSRLTPNLIRTSSLLPPDTPLLLLTLTAHAGLKHVLTEADRIVLGWVVGQGRGTAGRGKANEGLDDMAGYAVAGNYGEFSALGRFVAFGAVVCYVVTRKKLLLFEFAASLIARVIFQPVEESTRLYFSKALSQQQVKDEEKPQDKTAPRHIFILLIRSCLLLALLCPAFIPPALPFVLPYILPARYLSTSAPSTLLTYLTVYIPILALNGILEAVFSVTASSGGVANQGIVMIACTGAFGAALLIMKEARDAGWLGVGMESCLVLANAVQMGLRIGYAWIHARQVFRDGRSLSVRRVLPKWRTLGAVVFAAMALRWLVDGLKPGRVVDLAKVAGGGGALGLGCLWV